MCFATAVPRLDIDVHFGDTVTGTHQLIYKIIGKCKGLTVYTAMIAFIIKQISIWDMIESEHAYNGFGA